MARKVKIALPQLRVEVSPEANLRRTLAAFDEAAAHGAQIICTQELFRSFYFCQSENHDHFQLAETIPGPATEALSAWAGKNEIVVIASLFERRAPGVFHNTAVVIDADGQLAGRYRKMHIPDDPLYYEKFYFTTGDLGFPVFQTRLGRLGVLVCWDQWFPEAARLSALAGAEILFYPTAIGWHPAEKPAWGAKQLQAWETIQRGHAIANGLYVAAVNRVGHEKLAGDGIEFWGHSFVADPYGELIAEAGTNEEILYAACDLEEVERARTHWPFLRDRRVSAYDGLSRRVLD